MTDRYRSLDEALAAITSGPAGAGHSIVVSWGWWDSLSEAQRQAYRVRCDTLGVRLSADHRISPHFVEVSGGDEPPLSSERRV